MKDNMYTVTTTAKAPGKIILSGEHAVVYGAPALAMAVDHFVTTTLMPIKGSAHLFEFEFDNCSQVVSWVELQQLKVKLDNSYQDFLQGKVAINAVITKPLELIQYSLVRIVEDLFYPLPYGLKIKITTNLPIGGGMGVSAAVILSLMCVLSNHFDVVLTNEKYLQLGQALENLQHGKSSGLDLFMVLHGGAYLFVNGAVSRRELSEVPITLINTGKPQASTGECVAKCAKFFNDNTTLLDDFSATTLAMDQALTCGNSLAVKACIRENQRLLEYIGVVPDRVANFIAKVNIRGNAAKISGAGAVVGDCGGVVLMIGDAPIIDLVTTYGYEVLRVTGEAYGIRVV